MKNRIQDDVTRKTCLAIYWNTSLKLLYEVFRFGIGIILARILDPYDFGVVAIGSMVVVYSNSLSNFGFNNALVQYRETDRRLVNSVFTFNLLVSLILTLSFLILAPAVAGFFNNEESCMVIRALSIFFLLTTFRDIPESMMRRKLDYKSISIIEFLQATIQSVTALSLALMGFRYWSLVYANIASLAFGTLVFMFRSGWKPKIEYSHEKMRKIYSFGLWNFIRSQLFFINRYVLVLFIGRFLGVHSLGFFEKGESLASVPRESIGKYVNNILFSSFSRIQNNPGEIRAMAQKALVAQSILLMPLLVGLSSTSPHVVLLLLGEKWHFSIAPLQILSITNVFIIMNGTLASLNIGAGYFKEHTLRLSLGTVLLVALSALSLNSGITGLCLGYLSVSIIWFIMFVKLSIDKIDLPVKEIACAMGPYVGANIIMYVIVRLLGTFVFSEVSIQNFLTLIFVGGGGYALMVLGINRITKKALLYPLQYNYTSV